MAMQVIYLRDANIEESAALAADVLRAGGVVLYPTDTLYGLGVDALSDAAVAKIYAIKGRDKRKPMHAIVSDLGMVERYAVLTDDTRLLAERLPKGQATFVLKKKAGFGAGITKGISTLGFRIPDNDLCIRMLRTFGRPITATSANASGEKPQRSVDKIMTQLGANARTVDLIIDAGELPERKASTVVDLSGSEPEILREGAITASGIWKALRTE